MSVSLTLVPVALALRVIMGEKKFNDWIRSMQIRMPTKISQKSDLTTCLEKAGYDAKNFGDAVKTHIGTTKETFFFWEFENGKWVAVFSKQLPSIMINSFILNFENANNKKIFLNSDFKEEIGQIHRSPTNFKDESLLIKTLEEYGARPTKNNDEVVVNLEGTKLRFFRDLDEPYTVEIRNVSSDLEYVFNQLSLMDESYKQNVQSLTYENLKHNLEEKNMQIENEEILNDNSIVLTVNLDQ